MFGTQSERLLRTKWKNPTDLAQELYAMFLDTNPVETGAPIKITYNGADAPIQLVRNGSSSDLPFYTMKNGGSTSNIFMTSSGDLIFEGNTISFIQNRVDDPNSPDAEKEKTTLDQLKKKTPTQSGGGGIPGYVLSGGPGSSYQVTIYPEGLSGATSVVSATQLSIDAAATIPAGTAVIVVSVTNGSTTEYYIQVPVWGSNT